MTYLIKNSHPVLVITLWSFLCIILTAPPSLAQNKTSENIMSRFEEDNTLLLRPKAGNIYYEDDIYTILKNGKLYFSLIDVIDVLNLAVNFNHKTKKATGWFLREDWKIDIALNTSRVISRDKIYEIEPDDILKKDNTYFIEKSNLERWFSLTLIPDIPQQYVEVISAYPLPIVAKFSRENKRVANQTQTDPTLPRYTPERKWLDINTAGFQIGTRFQRTKTQNDILRTTRNSSNIALQGQILKHDAYLLGSYNNRDGLSSVIGRLSKRSEEANLLGPLKARSYSIGDTSIANIPLLGNTSQELGVSLSNNKLTRTQSQTTTIDGEAFPGWDVELYRNNILIDAQTIDTTGRYEFSKIQLFGGDNNFEVFFYGPQGEIQKRTITVPVTSALLTAQNNFYNLSASVSNSQLYQGNDIRGDQDQALHLTGQYNRRIGNALTYVGIRSREVNNQQKTLLGAGLTTSYKNMILDSNLSMDSNGETAGQLSLRRSLSGWNLLTTAKVQTDGYAPNGEENPSVLQINTSTQKSFQPTDTTRLSIFSRGNYNKLANDISQATTAIGANYQFKNFNLSNNLTYDKISFKGNETSTARHNFSTRYNKGKYFLRGGLETTLYPERKIESFFGQITYRPSYKVSGDVRIQHRLNQDKTEGRVNLNYTNDHFRTSPFIEYNSDQDLYAGVNLNFSIIDTPSDNGFEMTSKRLSGKGLVSSLVYHDKNGNLIFDAGDEILPDVIVESLNVRRRETTNEKGYSLIKDLPANRATDITIDKTTLPDSFMISATDGVSVFPNAGEIIELQFPIHLAGEVDGTVFIQDGEQTEAGRRAKLELHPIQALSDTIITIETALDGFYVGSEIPPGRYIMKVSDQTARQYKAGAPAPKVIEIGFEGNILYGQDIALDKNRPHIPVIIKRDNERKNNSNGIIAVNTKNQTQSKLASLLSDYAKKVASPDLLAHLPSTSDYQEISNNVASNIPHNQGIESTHNRCLTLMENGIPCAMEIVIPQAIERAL